MIYGGFKAILYIVEHNSISRIVLKREQMKHNHKHYDICEK